MSSSDFELLVPKRYRSGNLQEKLRYRDHKELSFVETVFQAPRKLLQDTTVYVDILHGKFSEFLKFRLEKSEIWHCSVTAAELAYPCGRLDPNHPKTAANIRDITDSIQHRSPSRTLSPDNEIWLQAGVIAGLIGRLHGNSSLETSGTLNDALIFLTALKHGCSVLTRNIRDFDLLQQIVPEGRVLFYERTA